MFNSTANMEEFDLELFDSTGGDSFATSFEGRDADQQVCIQERKADDIMASNNMMVEVHPKSKMNNVLGDAFAEAVGQADMTWIESTSDYQSMVDLSAEVKDEDEENIDTDALINDVEGFLKTYEAGINKDKDVIVPANVDNQILDGSMDFPLANSTFSEEETKAAEDLLDSLLQGEMEVDTSFLNGMVDQAIAAEAEKNAEAAKKQQEEEEKKQFVENQILGDSGFLELSNVTQVVTEDGRNIIIMVAPASADASDRITEVAAEDSYSNIASPAMSEAVSEASTVENMKSIKGRPTVERRLVSKTRKAPYAIKDKKERKKLQNVEAARRYRDKKKAEAWDIEKEESYLLEKNKTLKSEVNEIEAEIRTMRKLMVELGILKK